MTDIARDQKMLGEILDLTAQVSAAGALELKAVSLWQPWATGIAIRVKGIETRGRRTAHRGEIAIHAAKPWNAEQRSFAEAERALGTIGWGLPFGAIVAVCEIVDVVPTEQLVATISDVERRWGNYEPRRFGWLLANVRQLAEPVPCAGKQMLWDLPADVAAKVRAQL